MQEMKDHGRVGLAALRSGMHRNTGRRYLASGELPSERPPGRTLAYSVGPVRVRLAGARGSSGGRPGARSEGAIRRSLGPRAGSLPGGPAADVSAPGQAMASVCTDRTRRFSSLKRTVRVRRCRRDFTRCGSLGVTIAGEPFDHQLCHSVLPYCNWQSASVCRSESMLALSCGVQKAVFALGRVPDFHQTDNSTAATHTLTSLKRAFNDDYEALMRHMRDDSRARSASAASEQNGDIEAANGALKRRLDATPSPAGQPGFRQSRGLRALDRRAADSGQRTARQALELKSWR